MVREKRRSVTACIAEIRKLNTTFRKNPDMPERKSSPLMERKDALIDEMERLCAHPKVIATRGSKKRGLPSVPRRMCGKCGCCETLFLQPRFKVLTGRNREVVMLPANDYMLQQGLILRKTGVNI